jgi:hypothetical protein
MDWLALGGEGIVGGARLSLISYDAKTKVALQ